MRAAFPSYFLEIVIPYLAGGDASPEARTPNGLGGNMCIAKQSLLLRAALGVAIASGIILSFASTAFADSSTGQWTMGGKDLNNSRTQRQGPVNRGPVANLKLKWVFTTGGDVTATPAVVGNTVYFPDFVGNFYAVNATTGALVWSQAVSTWTGVANDFARDDPAFDNQTLFLGDQAGAKATWTQPSGPLVGAGARVIAVDAATGALKWATQVDAFPAAMITSSPVVYNGVVYVGVATGEEANAATPGYQCCSSSGSVVALDEASGKVLWRTKTLPTNPPNCLTAGGCYSGGSVWDSTPVIDPFRNSIYVGTGNNFSVPLSVSNCLAASLSNCIAPNDFFDSVLALDLTSGAIKWAVHGFSYDVWNVACVYVKPGTTPPPGSNCPYPTGPDFDFGGSGPNMLTVNGNSILGICKKSGFYWALDPSTGKVVWKTQVGPGSSLGGIEWGTAFDGTRIYVPISNLFGIPYALPGGTTANGGSWAALNPSTGQIVWQTATPGACPSLVAPGSQQGCMALGPASAANGVVFAGSMDVNPQNPTMFALDASSGNVLWSYVAGSSVNAAPAIAGDSIYWGSGYSKLGGLGTANNKVFAFQIPQNMQ
jgi:polyvinyl alcohol dehydrogenase (cytochrome)